MKTLTVRMSDELDAHLRREAARRGITLAQLIREVLEAYFARSGVRGTIVDEGT